MVFVENYLLGAAILLLIYEIGKNAFRGRIDIFAIVGFVLLLYGISLSWEERFASTATYMEMIRYERDPCMAPLLKWFSFNISESMSVQCEISDRFRINPDVPVVKFLNIWTQNRYNVPVRNIAFLDGTENIAYEELPDFAPNVKSILRGCSVVPISSDSMYNMKYNIRNCPLRIIKPYILCGSIISMLFMLLREKVFKNSFKICLWT
jgi:hypothetical protein